MFPDSAISPTILMSCSSHTEACNIGTTDGVTSHCVAGFAHQVIADAGAEVKAFNAYAKWCSDRAQVDDHQEETINASIASTNAAIEKIAAKAENAIADIFSYKLDRIGGLGVDRSECRERKRWRRTSANLRLNFRTLWILSSARSRFFVMR